MRIMSLTLLFQKHQAKHPIFIKSGN